MTTIPWTKLKEFLRQCVKYRFWISLSVAALFAIIAYFLGSSPVQAEADQETKSDHPGRQRREAIRLAGHSQRPVQADRRGEDRGPDQGRQLGLETALQPAGAPAHLAQDGPAAVPRVGPEMARERRRGRRRARQGRLHRGLSESTSTRSTRSSIPSTPRPARGSSPPRPRRPCSGPLVFDPNKLPELGDDLGGPGTALDPANRSWRSWPRSTRTPRIGTRPSSSRSTSWKSATQSAQDQRSIAKGETLEESEAIKAPGTEKPGSRRGSGRRGHASGMMRARWVEDG